MGTDALWQQLLFNGFLALHGGTLLRLSGVPLHMVACASHEEQPALDLSGLRLTKLGINCYAWAGLLRSHNSCMWLRPERMPGALEELELIGLHGIMLRGFLWAPCVGSSSPVLLPRLRTLCVTRVKGIIPFSLTDDFPLLEGFPVLPALQVECLGLVNADATLFSRVSSIRIAAGDRMCLWSEQESTAMLADRLCHAGLQAAELYAGDCICFGTSEGPTLYKFVREIVSRYGDRFAVELGIYERLLDEEKGHCRKTTLQRLAWRRWPAPGAPELPAARAAHEHARTWVADAEQWVAEQRQQEHLL